MITSLGSCFLLHRNLRPMQQKRSARIALRRGASATHRRRRILQNRILFSDRNLYLERKREDENTVL